MIFIFSLHQTTRSFSAECSSSDFSTAQTKNNKKGLNERKTKQYLGEFLKKISFYSFCSEFFDEAKKRKTTKA